jgi:hypothetical protein
LTITNPGFLYLLLLIPAIIILHLIRKRHKRAVVSSLLIWDQVLKSSRRVFFTSRLLRSLLLLLQLCVLLLISLSLVGISMEIPGKGYDEDLILVLDVSASMKAESKDGSRFDEAIKEAERIIRNLAPEKGILCMTAGKHPDILLPYTKDKQKILAALRNLEATDEAGDIDDALREAMSMAGMSGD